MEIQNNTGGINLNIIYPLINEKRLKPNDSTNATDTD